MESVLASKRVDILKLLLENHYLRSFYLRGMVLYAAAHSSAECMALLLKMEYTFPNEAGEDGDTALHIAARRMMPTWCGLFWRMVVAGHPKETGSGRPPCNLLWSRVMQKRRQCCAPWATGLNNG